MKNNSSILIIFGLIICGFFASCGSESDPGLKTALDNGQITTDINEADGFAAPQGTLMINDGEVAGQTINHLHIHLIPRYKGDSQDPRGGIRWIFPDKAPYWESNE